MERAQPRHALANRPGERADALLHLARRLVGEGDGQNLMRLRAARRDDVGDARRQHARLAGACPRQHQHGTIHSLDGCPLFGIQNIEIARLGHASLHGGLSARSNAPDTRSAGDRQVGLVEIFKRISHEACGP